MCHSLVSYLLAFTDSFNVWLRLENIWVDTSFPVLLLCPNLAWLLPTPPGSPLVLCTPVQAILLLGLLSIPAHLANSVHAFRLSTTISLGEASPTQSKWGQMPLLGLPKSCASHISVEVYDTHI